MADYVVLYMWNEGSEVERVNDAELEIILSTAHYHTVVYREETLADTLVGVGAIVRKLVRNNPVHALAVTNFFNNSPTGLLKADDWKNNRLDNGHGVGPNPGNPNPGNPNSVNRNAK